MVELDMANQFLREGRGHRESKQSEVPVGRRNTEETGLQLHSEKEYFQPGGEFIARREGERTVSYAQVVKHGGREKTSSQDLSVPKEVLVGSKHLKGSMQGEVAARVEVAPATTSQAKHSALEELPKRHMSAVSLSAINDKQELCNLRDWLEQLRGEVVAGIGRLDALISNLILTDSEKGRKVMGRGFQSKSFFKPKRNYWAGKKKWVRKAKGEILGSGPTGMENPLVREEEPKEFPVSLEGNACLGIVGRDKEDGPPAKMMAGDERRPVEVQTVVAAEDDGRRLGLSSSVSVGTSGEAGRIHGGLEEEVSTSWVKDTGEEGLLVVGVEGEGASGNQRGLATHVKVVGGVRRLGKDFNIGSGPGRVEGAGPIAMGQGENSGLSQEGAKVLLARPPVFSQGPRGENSHQRRDRRSPVLEQTGPTEPIQSGFGLTVAQNWEGRAPEVTQGTRLELAQDSDQRRGHSSPEMAQIGSTEYLSSGHGSDEVQNREGRSPEVTQGRRLELAQDSDQRRGQSSPEMAQIGSMESLRSGHGLDEVQNREGRSPEVTQGRRLELAQDADQRRGQSSPEMAQIGSTESLSSGHGLDEVQNREGRSPERHVVLQVTPEIGQSGPMVHFQAGHGRQVTDDGTGMVSDVSLVAGGGFLPETPQLGDMPGILGTFVNMAEGEKIGVVTPLDEVDTSVILRVTQDLMSGKEDSPAARELQLALEDSGIAGLSCDGQMRKLAGVLGQIIAKKYGLEGEQQGGLLEGDIHQMRGSMFVNDA
jgi:hypothetical protein